MAGKRYLEVQQPGRMGKPLQMVVDKQRYSSDYTDDFIDFNAIIWSIGFDRQNQVVLNKK
jgi:hypothetical protein